MSLAAQHLACATPSFSTPFTVTVACNEPVGRNTSSSASPLMDKGSCARARDLAVYVTTKELSAPSSHIPAPQLLPQANSG